MTKFQIGRKYAKEIVKTYGTRKKEQRANIPIVQAKARSTKRKPDISTILLDLQSDEEFNEEEVTVRLSDNS